MKVTMWLLQLVPLDPFEQGPHKPELVEAAGWAGSYNGGEWMWGAHMGGNLVGPATVPQWELKGRTILYQN
jgi:hypothetical protein